MAKRWWKCGKSVRFCFLGLHNQCGWWLHYKIKRNLLLGRIALTNLSERKWSRSDVSNSLGPRGLCSLPGFSVHGILQARILEWVTISFSRGSSRPRVSRIGGRRFNLWATREADKLKCIFKSRDITLSTKVCIVKATVFSVATYGCES